MKLPIPEELTNQLSQTADLMQQIVDGLSAIDDKLGRLVELEEARQ